MCVRSATASSGGSTATRPTCSRCRGATAPSGSWRDSVAQRRCGPPCERRSTRATSAGPRRWGSWLVHRDDADGVSAATDDDRLLLAEVLRTIGRRTPSANIRNWCLTRALELDGTLDLDRLRVHVFGRGRPCSVRHPPSPCTRCGCSSTRTRPPVSTTSSAGASPTARVVGPADAQPRGGAHRAGSTPSSSSPSISRPGPTSVRGAPPSPPPSRAVGWSCTAIGSGSTGSWGVSITRCFAA